MNRGWLVIAAVAATLGVAASTATAAPSPQNISPANGATVPYGTSVNDGFLHYTCPSYTTSFNSSINFGSYWFQIATKPDLDSDGTLADQNTIALGHGSPTNSPPTQCRNGDNGPDVLNPGTYYWQAFVVDCDFPNCYNTGPVWSFKVVDLTPDTYFTQKPPKRSKKRTATFAFSSSIAGAKFQCEYASGWSGCTSPQVFRRLRPGRYAFAVRAVANGRIDPTPATARFRILRRR